MAYFLLFLVSGLLLYYSYARTYIFPGATQQASKMRIIIGIIDLERASSLSLEFSQRRFFRGIKDYIHVTILQSGSKAHQGSRQTH